MSNREIAQRPAFSAFLNTIKIKQSLENSLKDPLRIQSFTTGIVSAVTANPALQNCDYHSLLSCALLGESLKLSPSPQLGMYYIVPFEQKEKKDKSGNVISPAKTLATFILGWKGYAQLAMRSGQYKNINVCAVKKGEFVSYDPFRETVVLNPITDPLEREVAETEGYYAFFEYLNGFRKEIYWSKEKMIQHAMRYSKAVAAAPAKGSFPGRVSLREYLAGNWDEKNEWVYSSFWHKDFDTMALKTMLRQLISKWGVMSVEMQTGIACDNTAITEDGTPEHITNEDIPFVTDETPQEKSDETVSDDGADDDDAQRIKSLADLE